MSDQSIFIIVICLVLIVVFRKPILTSSLQLDPVKEQYPIVYPKEPMFENYTDIIQEILDAHDEKTLNTAYVRLLIFQGCYEDSQSFADELIKYYKEKEALINSNTYRST